MDSGGWALFDFVSFSKRVPEIEVFSGESNNFLLFHIFGKSSPNPRSHEVRRILSLRDQFHASWR